MNEIVKRAQALFPSLTATEIESAMKSLKEYNDAVKYLETKQPTSTFVVSKEGTSPERVNHPSHYTWLKDKCGIEVIDITRHMDFCLGNALKYLLRAGHKSEEGYSDNEKTVEDLKKAIWYINDKINSLQHGE